MNTILFFDCNNLFHKNYHNNRKYGTDEEAVAMSIHSTLMDMRKYYEKYTPIITIAAFDSAKNWRKDYTKFSPNKVTNKVYKANRSEKKTKKELDAKKMLDEAMEETAAMFKEYSKLVVLKKDGLEVDDMASGICRIFGDSEYDIKLLTSDKDFLQFYKYTNVEVVNPLHNGENRNLIDWNNDANLFLFEKCIRGDGKDNVRSSYPRVRKTKIHEAYYDEFKKINLMNHTFEETIYDEQSDEYITRTYRVGDIFEENRILLDLNAQPDKVKEEIDSHVEEEISKKKKLNFVKFLKFFKKKELEKLVTTSQNYIPLLSNKRFTH